MTKDTLIHKHLIRTESPIGRLEVTSDGERITSLTIERKGQLPHDAEPERSSPLLRRAVKQLAEYFAGTRHEFDLPTKMSGSDFQLRVWNRLTTIGWGEYLSYGELGAEIGQPGSGRAVGGAIRTNPIPIIVGCHRVLGSDGHLTGYSQGKGIPTKRWLLEHETESS